MEARRSYLCRFGYKFCLFSPLATICFKNKSDCYFGVDGDELGGAIAPSYKSQQIGALGARAYGDL